MPDGHLQKVRDRRCTSGVLEREADGIHGAMAGGAFRVGAVQLELLDQQQWKTRQQLSTAIFDYTEVFFNRQRLHSTLGYLSPLEFEQRYLSDSATVH